MWEQGKAGLYLPTEPTKSERGLIVHAFVGEYPLVRGLINRGYAIDIAVDSEKEKIERYQASFGSSCKDARVLASKQMTSSALFPGGAPNVALLMGSPNVESKVSDPTGRTFDEKRSQLLVFARLVRSLRPATYVLSPDSLVAMSKLVTPKGKPLLDAYIEIVCRDRWTRPEALKRSLLSNKEAMANYEAVLAERRPQKQSKPVIDHGQQTEIDFGIGLETENPTLF